MLSLGGPTFKKIIIIIVFQPFQKMVEKYNNIARGTGGIKNRIQTGKSHSRPDPNNKNTLTVNPLSNLNLAGGTKSKTNETKQNILTQLLSLPRKDP